VASSTLFFCAFVSLTFYFLRHGETEASLSGSYCGSLDIDLTPEGYQMAEDFAAKYQSLSWKAVFASPLYRTRATAKPLCDAVGIEMQPRDGLKEIAYGEWEGKMPATVNRDYHDEYVRWLADPGWNAPTKGEKGIEIARRSAQVLEEIEQTYQTGNILVVSHKATIRIILCYLLGIDVGRFRDRINMPVASVSIVEMAERGPLLRALGDTAHLTCPIRNLNS
jgi:broad specificity phosphatase PhoE